MESIRLRPVTPTDMTPLLELLSLPPVYEFLSDGVVPDLELAEGWVAEARDGPAPCGLWLLEEPDAPLLGCVRLSPVEDDASSVELSYVLHPSAWGQGLASAMSRSAIAHAFSHESCASVLAGADAPNRRSVAVMERIGMEFFRDVEYPAGPGVEYRMTRAAFSAGPRGREIAMTAGEGSA